MRVDPLTITWATYRNYQSRNRENIENVEVWRYSVSVCGLLDTSMIMMM